MRKILSISILLASSAILSGCVGGTTYGTGVTHEQQTLEGLSNIFSIRKKRGAEINYTTRPELVMPSNKTDLPQPYESESSTSNADWPETPAQRIARIRGEAVEADERSGNIPVEEQLRKKDGIRVTKSRERNPDRDGNALIDIVRDGDAQGAEARKRRQELAYATGAKRKYLTEPPVEYRTPAATAIAGDLGYSKEELEEIEKKAKAEQKSRDTGHWIE